ncbi:hypothetical protein pb186bvf_006525 [Paramecium bursaria]
MQQILSTNYKQILKTQQITKFRSENQIQNYCIQIYRSQDQQIINYQRGRKSALMIMKRKLRELLQNQQIRINGLNYFTHKSGKSQTQYENVSMIYLSVDEPQIIHLSDFLIRQFIDLEIIDVDDLKKNEFRIFDQSNYNFKNVFEKYQNLYLEVPIKSIEISNRQVFDEDGYYSRLTKIIL